MAKKWQVIINRYLRNLIFGLEDGMVSTLGALTGIAIGARNQAIVYLAGIVVICVESLSMAIGTFLSSRSRMESIKAKIQYELHEIRTDPEGERRELEDWYGQMGFPSEERDIVIKRIMGNEALLLEEMMFREFGIGSEAIESPAANAAVMFFAYILGGVVPFCAYFLWPLATALPSSFLITLLFLFGLGAVSSIYSPRPWWRLGLSFFLFGGIAAAIGYGVGLFLHNRLAL